MKKTKLIIDGNNLAFRMAATILLTNEAGEPIGVPFGSLKSIRFLIDKFKPDKAVICWDGGRSKIRMQEYPEYKGKRYTRGKEEDILAAKRMRENVITMIEQLHGVFSWLGIRQVKFKGTECDDVIANMVLRGKGNDIIVSSDKDFIQLINDTTAVYNPIDDILVTEKNINTYKKLGFNAKQFLEYHILLGDSSDNISGINGVGEKTAQKIIRTYGTIEKAWSKLKYEKKIDRHSSKLLLDESKKIVNRNRMLIDLRYFNERYFKTRYKNELRGNNICPKPDYDENKVYNFLKDERFKFKSLYSDFNYFMLPYRLLNIRERKNARKDNSKN